MKEALGFCVLLNALQYRVSRRKEEVIRALEDRWLLERDDIIGAAKRLRLTEKDNDGEIWWERPANVVALWWWRKDDSWIYLRGTR